jgi:hypothetical protein
MMFVTRAGTSLTWLGIRRFVERATRKAFGRSYTFHCFRHTAAVRVYRRTRDVLAVQRFLGHNSLQWTQSYLRSIEVVDVGGPVAFVEHTGPRLFDPESCVDSAVRDRNGDPPSRRRIGGKAAAAGDQDAHTGDLAVKKIRRAGSQRKTESITAEARKVLDQVRNCQHRRWDFELRNGRPARVCRECGKLLEWCRPPDGDLPGQKLFFL